MADVSEAQIRKAVERATAEVFNEAKGFDAEAFKVSDLRAQLDGFAGGKLGDEVAWTISYSTSSVVAEDPLGSLGEAAWTISYSTSSIVVDKAEEVARTAAVRRAKA